MFLSGMSPSSATLFSVPTLIITIPSAIVTLLWLGTIYRSKLRLTTASLFCLGFVSVFVTGGLSGFFLSQPSIDTYLHGTYFVVGHFHFVMAVAAMFGIFAGTYFWFPKIFGRMMNETLGKWHFALTFLGVYATFMPMHWLGLAGNVRRYSSFPSDYMHGSLPLHRFITFSALFLGARPAHFPGESDLEQVPRSDCACEPVGGDDAGVDHNLSAAVRQLRRRASGSVSRAQ